MQVQSLLFVSFLTRKWPRGWLYVCFVRFIRSFRYVHSTVDFPTNSLRKLSSQGGSSKRKHSKFRDSSEPIMYMIILQYVNWVSIDPKKYKKVFSIMSIIISRIAVRSWHQSHDILPIKRDAFSWREILSTRKCGLFWSLVLPSGDRLSLRA